ncbi:MAG TPA: hypothetical protein VF862_02635 [Gemmatimonadales bacterium]
MMALAGVVLSAVLGGVAWAVWGRPGAIGAVTFGLLATAIQVVATRLMRGSREARFDAFLTKWGAGMGLRMAGILVFMLVVSLQRDLFPPLASAMGFLGVLLPLLALEIRLVQR